MLVYAQKFLSFHAFLQARDLTNKNVRDKITKDKFRCAIALSQYRLEVLLDERLAAEVLAGEVLPPRHLLPVRASSLRPHARARRQHLYPQILAIIRTRQSSKRLTMKARDGSATRSEAATRAAAPALARWKCTEERAGVAGGAAPARAGGDGASLRAPRMSMAGCSFLSPYVAACLSVLSVWWRCLAGQPVAVRHGGCFSQPVAHTSLFLFLFFCWTKQR
jgi:hypothetical protein